jgi:glycosyltransferase involved in cell wall biosynthesis
LKIHGHDSQVNSFQSVPPVLRRWAIQAPGYTFNRLHKGAGFYYSQRMRQLALRQILQKECAKNNYHLIHAQDIFAALASSRLDRPTVLTVHGYFAQEALSKGALKKSKLIYPKLLELERAAYRSADAVITVDQRLHDYVYRLSGVKAKVLPNFIDTTYFRPKTQLKLEARRALQLSQDKTYILVPRRLTEKNGVIHPVMILANLMKKYPNIHLLLAGDGEVKREINRVVDRDRLHGHITLLGNVPYELMPAYYAAVDLVIIPSVHSEGVEEATSISALEAMGSGVPVIAGSVGGLKQLIDHGENGWLVDATLHSELSEAILSLLKDQPKQLKFASAAREKVCTRHSHLSAAKELIQFYESIGARSS